MGWKPRKCPMCGDKANVIEVKYEYIDKESLAEYRQIPIEDLTYTYSRNKYLDDDYKWFCKKCKIEFTKDKRVYSVMLDE